MTATSEQNRADAARTGRFDVVVIGGGQAGPGHRARHLAHHARLRSQAVEPA